MTIAEDKEKNQPKVTPEQLVLSATFDFVGEVLQTYMPTDEFEGKVSGPMSQFLDTMAIVESAIETGDMQLTASVRPVDTDDHEIIAKLIHQGILTPGYKVAANILSEGASAIATGNRSNCIIYMYGADATLFQSESTMLTQTKDTVARGVRSQEAITSNLSALPQVLLNIVIKDATTNLDQYNVWIIIFRKGNKYLVRLSRFQSLLEDASTYIDHGNQVIITQSHSTSASFGHAIEIPQEKYINFRSKLETLKSKVNI